jgi:hypothetical protein
MAFSAGAITGTLSLDNSQFTESMRESSSLTGQFAVELGRVFAEATGSPILGELANGFSEIAASIGEGNWAEAASAGIHLIGAAVSGAIEMVKKMGEEMHNMGLAAERAGVDVEWFSSFSKAAADAGVNVDELGATMKFLQRNATDAVEGNKEMIEHFQQLGLSVDFLKDHLNDTQGLFTATIQGLGGLNSDALKTTEAMNILGRGGSSLKPIFDDGGKSTNELADKIRALGADTSEQDAKMGDGFSQLATIFNAAIEGIEKAAAKPILAELIAHSQDLEDGLMGLVQTFNKYLPDAITLTKGIFEGLYVVLKPVIDAIKIIVDGVNLVRNAGIDVGQAIGEAYGESEGADDAASRPAIHYRGAAQPQAAAAQPATLNVNVNMNGLNSEQASRAASKAAGRAVDQHNAKLQKQLEDQARVKSVVK